MTNDFIADELLHISGKKAVLEFVEMIGDNNESINFIYSLTFSDNAKVRWHAIWVFEHLYFLNLSNFSYLLPDLIKRLPNEKSDSVKRHITKILSFSEINNLIDGVFIDTCFN